MRVLVCGSRDYDDSITLSDELTLWHSEHGITLLIHGDAKGADRMAAAWADDRDIPVLKFPADWKSHGKSAGPIRNALMLVTGRPDVVLAFPKGRLNDSNGTKDMVKQARAAGIATIVIGENDG